MDDLERYTAVAANLDGIVATIGALGVAVALSSATFLTAVGVAAIAVPAYFVARPVGKFIFERFLLPKIDALHENLAEFDGHRHNQKLGAVAKHIAKGETVRDARSREPEEEKTLRSQAGKLFNRYETSGVCRAMSVLAGGLFGGMAYIDLSMSHHPIAGAITWAALPLLGYAGFSWVHRRTEAPLAEAQEKYAVAVEPYLRKKGLVA